VSEIPPQIVALYEKVLATNPKIERKGNTNPYTSHNGHMFTHLSPPGRLAIRLPPAEIKAFIKKYKTTLLEAYGVVKKGWVVVPDRLLRKTTELAPYVEASYRFVKTLKPKTTTAKKSVRTSR
jgi:hypothetical protein